MRRGELPVFRKGMWWQEYGPERREQRRREWLLRIGVQKTAIHASAEAKRHLLTPSWAQSVGVR